MLGDDDRAEGIAAEASQESGLDDRPHADPSILAVSYCGLRLVPHASSGARLADGRVFFPRAAPPQERAFLVAHEVGHDLVRWARWKLRPAAEEAAASRIGCAIILPRRAFLRDARATRGCLLELQALWALATPWVLARRLCELGEAEGAAVYSGAGKLRRSIGVVPPLERAIEIGGVLLSVA